MNKYEKAFVRLQGCAVAGDRCPQNDQIPSAVFSALAREGKILVKVFARNWRVVEILVGPYAGRSTADDPLRRAGEKPYKVIDAKQEPWKPGTPRPVAPNVMPSCAAKIRSGRA